MQNIKNEDTDGQKINIGEISFKNISFKDPNDINKCRQEELYKLRNELKKEIGDSLINVYNKLMNTIDKKIGYETTDQNQIELNDDEINLFKNEILDDKDSNKDLFINLENVIEEKLKNGKLFSNNGVDFFYDETTQNENVKKGPKVLMPQHKKFKSLTGESNSDYNYPSNIILNANINNYNKYLTNESNILPKNELNEPNIKNNEFIEEDLDFNTNLFQEEFEIERKKDKCIKEKKQETNYNKNNVLSDSTKKHVRILKIKPPLNLNSNKIKIKSLDKINTNSSNNSSINTNYLIEKIPKIKKTINKDNNLKQIQNSESLRIDLKCSSIENENHEIADSKKTKNLILRTSNFQMTSSMKSPLENYQNKRLINIIGSKEKIYNNKSNNNNQSLQKNQSVNLNNRQDNKCEKELTPKFKKIINLSNYYNNKSENKKQQISKINAETIKVDKTNCEEIMLKYKNKKNFNENIKKNVNKNILSNKSKKIYSNKIIDKNCCSKIKIDDNERSNSNNKEESNNLIKKKNYNIQINNDKFEYILGKTNNNDKKIFNKNLSSNINKHKVKRQIKK